MGSTCVPNTIVTQSNVVPFVIICFSLSDCIGFLFQISLPSTHPFRCVECECKRHRDKDLKYRRSLVCQIFCLLVFCVMKILSIEVGKMKKIRLLSLTPHLTLCSGSFRYLREHINNVATMLNDRFVIYFRQKCCHHMVFISFASFNILKKGKKNKRFVRLF